MDATGSKRKLHENAFTAKAENGTLRVKIMRRDKNQAANGRRALAPAPPSSQLPTVSWSQDALSHSDTMMTMPVSVSSTASTSSMEPVQAELPKPRPNRKHVPIFYQRPTTLLDLSGSRSTEDTAMRSGSTSQDGSMEMSVSTGSAKMVFDPPPARNPLFSRGDSGGASLLSEILNPMLPGQHVAPTYPSASSGMMSYEDHSASPLHQLAASSATFGQGFPKNPHAMGTAASSVSSVSHVNYHRANAFSALQSVVHSHLNAVDHDASHTQPTLMVNSATPMASDDTEMSEARTEDDLGPPPSAPPNFTVQHSLVGGGIEMAPVVANVNTRNFDWSRRTHGRPRSGSLPNIPTPFPELVVAADAADGQRSSGAGNAPSLFPMYKEV